MFVLMLTSGCSTPEEKALEDTKALYLRLVSGDETARGPLLDMAANAAQAQEDVGERAYYIGLATDPQRFPDVAGTSAKVAAVLYRQAMDKVPAAGFNLAILALSNGIPLQDGESIRSLIENAANAGLVDAMVLMGYFLKEGTPGFEKSTAAAANWFEKAAQFSKNPVAELELAKLLEAEDAQRHATRINELLISASNQGMAEAAAHLAVLSRSPITQARWALLAGQLDSRYASDAKNLLKKLNADKIESIWQDIYAWQASHRANAAKGIEVGKPIDLMSAKLND